MFGYQLLLGTFAIVLAVIGHAGGLVTPAATLKKCSRQIQSNVIILTIAILGVVFIHTIEA